jgi:hypothetical protein
VILEGAADMPNLEQETEFNQALQQFLQSITPTPERQR